jgi:hypothetical protein
MTSDYQERDRVRDQRSADPSADACGVLVSDVSDARVWVPTLVRMIDALEMRVRMLEAKASRTIGSTR